MKEKNTEREELLSLLKDAIALTKPDGSPNINALWHQLKELNAVKWSVKQNGYNLGRDVFEAIRALPVARHPIQVELKNKCSTQDDIESDWFRYWMSELQVAPLPHRKLWEFAFILQNLHQWGMLEAGRSAIGFGCGEEPLPSYLASRGLNVTVTDLEPQAVAGRGWAETGQHTSGLESAFKENLIDRHEFGKRVSLKYVDMNRIPSTLEGQYDFCWSVCALEHLGSIQNGLNFIRNSLSVLKPGGLALHTTEFNYTEDQLTIDNWPTVLFLRKNFIDLSDQLVAAGHTVLPLDFDVGHKPLDAFIDLPPYDFPSFLKYTPRNRDNEFRPGHLKLSIDGFPRPC